MRTLTCDELKDVLVGEIGLDISDGASLQWDQARFVDLGVDSLGLLQVVSALEQRYGIEVPDQAIHGLATPSALVDYVNCRQREVA